MINFLKNIGRSVYSPSFYAELKKKSKWMSARYYFGFIIIIAIILGSSVSAIFVPIAARVVADGLPVASGLYPKNLVVTVKSGQAASNVKEPLFIKTPAELLAKIKTESGTILPDNLVTINTALPYSAERFASYKTVILVAKDGFAIIKDETTSGFTSDFRSYTADFVMTKEKYDGYMANISDVASHLPEFATIFFILMFFIVGVGRLVYFLFAALLVWLFLRTTGRSDATYGYSYKVAIHAATLPILLNFILAFVTGNIRILGIVPFLFTLMLLAVVWLNFKKGTVVTAKT